MTPKQSTALAAIDASIVSLTVAAADLRASLRPDPIDPPVDPPPVEPPPPSGRPADLDRSVTGNVIVFADWLRSSRYERYERLTILRPGGSVRIRAVRPGGETRVFAAARYVLLLDGIARAEAAPAAGARELEFGPLDLSAVPEGWVTLGVAGDAGESVAPWVAYVQHGADPVPQPWLPVVTNSHIWAASAAAMVRIRWVPARWAPTVMPLVPRAATPIAAVPDRTHVFEQHLVVRRIDDVDRPRTWKGLMFSHDFEPYFMDHLIAATPALPQIDGPRGVGTVTMPTHLVFGHAGGLYFTEGTRFGHISADGTVRTIAGYRHSAPPEMAAAPLSALVPELVGDWSAIPAERRGFHEVWGWAWDHRTTQIDETADPVEVSPGVFLQPHSGPGPTGYVSDTQRGRICRVRSSPRQLGVPAVVTEHITDLSDPWDVVCDAGVLYVSERGANRIAAYDADTGAFIRVIVQGVGNFGFVDANRKPIRTGSLDAVRAQPCYMPEGLYLQDGWLNWGSIVCEDIRRVRADAELAPREDVEVVQVLTRPVLIDENSHFVKLAVSDGTFGPRGTVYWVTWSATNYGYPLPMNIQGKSGQGPGPLWRGMGYGSALAIADGRMACGSSAEGISLITAATAADVTTTANSPVNRGFAEWHARGCNLRHGRDGFGYFGEPLPWGASDDIDAYLRANGHTTESKG